MIRNRRPLWILCLQIEKSTLTESLFPTASQHQVSAFRWILALDRHWRLSRKRKATLVIAQRRWGHKEIRFTKSTSNFRPHGCRDSTGDPPKRGPGFHSRRESEHYIGTWTWIQVLEEEWAISFKPPGRIDILPKHSRLFITNRLLQAVFIIDMHCPL